MHTDAKKMLRRLVTSALAGVILLVAARQATCEVQNLTIGTGSSRIVTGIGIKQVAVSDPTVVDLQPVMSSEILLVGKTPGVTQVYVWDRCGRREFIVTVTSTKQGIQPFARTVQNEIGMLGVKVEPAGDTLILRGQVQSPDELKRAEAIAKALYPKVENALTVLTTVRESTLSAISAALSKWGLKAEATPDGKVLVTGTLADSTILAEVVRTLKSWDKEADFVLAVDLTKTPQQAAAEALSQALSRWNLKVTTVPDGRVLVQGTVPNKEALAATEAIIKDWPRGVEIIAQVSVADMTEAKQVLIRARVVEVDRNDLKDLGVDWSRIVFVQSGSGTSTYTAEDQPFIIGQGSAGPFPLFGGPAIEQLDPIGARISALITIDKAHILSQPTLVTASGQPANILIGGEIPIPVPQSGVGAAAVITIEYKEFGIQLTVTPYVGENCEVSMVVKPEVSSLDFANSIIVSGIRVPALRTRRAEATVHVRSGCSMAIGGLLSSEDIRGSKAIPLLSKIPILGNFFRSVSNSKNTSELIIVVTPEVVNATEPCDVVHNDGVDIPLRDRDTILPCDPWAKQPQVESGK